KVRTVSADGGNNNIGYRSSLSADGKTMLEVSQSSDLMIVDLVADRSRSLKSNAWSHPGWPHEICLSKGGKLAATAIKKAIELWDVATGKQLRSWNPGKSDVIGLALSPDEKFVASDD